MSAQSKNHLQIGRWTPGKPTAIFTRKFAARPISSMSRVEDNRAGN